MASRVTHAAKSKNQSQTEAKMKNVGLFRIVLASIALAIAATLASMTEASPSVAAPLSNYVTGCTGEYFNNTSLFGSPVLVRSDAEINFYWPERTSPGVGVNASYYSVRWTCYVNVTTAGTYSFTITADDGMNLLVDNSLLIWAWYDQGPSSYSNPIYLDAGGHTIRVEYYNSTLGGTARVSSNLTGTITSSNYSSGLVSNCTGEYFNNTDLSGTPALVRSDSAIDFYWTAGIAPGSGINTGYYSVRWNCAFYAAASRGYTFNAVTDDGMNVWVDGNYLISAWQDQSASAYSNSIYLNAGTHLVRVDYYNRTMSGTAQVSVR